MTRLDALMATPVSFGGAVVTVAALERHLTDEGLSVLARGRMILQAMDNAERFGVPAQPVLGRVPTEDEMLGSPAVFGLDEPSDLPCPEVAEPC